MQCIQGHLVARNKNISVLVRLRDSYKVLLAGYFASGLSLNPISLNSVLMPHQGFSNIFA